MWCHWNQHCCYVMLILLSMASFCSLWEDSWKKVWHDSFGHVIQLALVSASKDTDGTVKDTILFLASNDWKCDPTYLIGHMMPVLASHNTDASSTAPLHLFFQHDWNEVQHNIFSNLTLLALASASCDANSIVNSTIAFIRPTWLKQCITKHFWHVMPLVLVSCHIMPKVSSMGLLHLLGQDDIYNAKHDLLVMWHHWCWHWHHMILTIIPMAPLHSLGQDDWNEVQHDLF